MNHWVGWIVFAIAAGVWAYLAHRFQPRCERHGNPVSIDRLASLGCKQCIEEDAGKFWKERRAEESARRKEAVQEVIADDEIMDAFIRRLQDFCKETVTPALAELEAAKREGRAPGPVS